LIWNFLPVQTRSHPLNNTCVIMLWHGSGAGVMKINEDDEGEASGVFAPSELNVDVEKELHDMAEQVSSTPDST